MAHEQRILSLSWLLVDEIGLTWHHEIVYLVLAAACLLVALRLMKRALEPIGVLVRAVAAATFAVLLVSLSLLLLALALAGY